ncbi:MAG: Arc family DNA-binding protein [Mogibacterium sp.]|nr:Arc family DNA-binding protein [Mogibacterium sp.]
MILRLPESLWRDIARWAEDDFRSIIVQIEYILTRSVNEHKGK